MIPLMRRKEITASYLFLLPALVLLIVFYIVPTLYAFIISFTEYSVLKPPKWNGGVNYIRILTSSTFLQATLNTVVYSLYFIPGIILVSFIIATFLQEFGGRWSGPLLTAFYVPRMTSMVVASFIWLWMYQPDSGLLNSILKFFHLPPQQWIYSTTTVLPSVALVTIWKDFGYTTVLLVAGMQSIQTELYEAARIDGANRWQSFWRITVPLLKPVTLLVVVKTFIDSFRAFTQIFVMTKGGPANASSTIVHQIYVTGFNYLRLGEASAMSFVLLVLLMIAFIPYIRMLRAESDV
ncbi:MAG TPA: sugar ABC transporter permease [Spirochaetales bacterium]|nr:sugar ABC transporter permease [Spirochaetales bacterium]